MATANSSLNPKMDDWSPEDDDQWEDMIISYRGPSMNEVIPNLWLGELGAATNAKLLREKNVKYILSATGFTRKLDPSFINYQIDLQDTESADLIVHLPPCIAFIESALGTGSGILVHCMVGVSRSPSVIAAYLMYSKQHELDTAVATIKMARPIVRPNRSFMKQLRLFEAVSYQVNEKDKGTRAFSLERAVASILKGGTPSDDVLARYIAPQTTTESGESSQPERRIRCKMCRREVATRVNMTHLGPSKSAADSTRSELIFNAPTILQPLRAARTSTSIVRTLIGKPQPASGSIASSDAFAGALGVEAKLNPVDQYFSKLWVGDEKAEGDIPKTDDDHATQKNSADDSSTEDQRLNSTEREHSNPLMAFKQDILAGIRSRPVIPPISRPPVSYHGSTPGANPTPSQTVLQASGTNADPPPLCGSTCSGYFLEPMKWMGPVLQQGEVEGQIICPNEKCGAKLGDYAWTGVYCSCGDWVTPGFCIAKAKVDDIW